MADKDYRPIVHCTQCDKSVPGKVRDSYSYEAYEGYEVGYLFVECPNCPQPFLCTRSGDIVGTDQWGGNEVDWSEAETLYPSDRSSLDDTVPPKIAWSYMEAARCYQSACYTATAIMCRRTLEGICHHFGENASQVSLKKKLEKLKDAGKIEAKLHDWADAVLREVGNDAAHNVESTVDKQDARDVLEFTRALIEYLFTFEQAFEAFQKRRAERKKRAEGTEEAEG